jgi:hypothetical protein
MPPTADAASSFNRQLRQIAASLAKRAGGGHEYARFVCECGCKQTVELAVREYDLRGGAWLEGHRPT